MVPSRVTLLGGILDKLAINCSIKKEESGSNKITDFVRFGETRTKKHSSTIIKNLCL